MHVNPFQAYCRKVEHVIAFNKEWYSRKTKGQFDSRVYGILTGRLKNLNTDGYRIYLMLCGEYTNSYLDEVKLVPWKEKLNQELKRLDIRYSDI